MQELREFLTPSERKKRIFYLLLTFVPILGSYILIPGAKISFLGCPLLRYVGIPCPAWGLTRSFMAFARGNFEQALNYHFFGPILFLGFLIGAIHLSLELSINRKIQLFYVQLIQNPRFQVFGFLVILSYHSVRLQGLCNSGELYYNMLHSPLGVWFWL